MTGASFWRRVDSRVWEADEKFRLLSAPPPNAQTLFLYFLTGPVTKPLPGLFVAGVGQLAESFGWPIGATDAALGELINSGMVRFDRANRVVYLPNSLKYNQPDNPNILVGWARYFSMIPPSPLKLEFWERLKQYTRQYTRQNVSNKAVNLITAFDSNFKKPTVIPTTKQVNLFPGNVPQTVTDTLPQTVTETGQGRGQGRGRGIKTLSGLENADPVALEVISKPPYGEIIGMLNELAGTRFRESSKANRNLIRARWNEGFRLEHFHAVIVDRVKKWGVDGKMVEYLRPKTLFNASNFESYLNGRTDARSTGAGIPPKNDSTPPPMEITQTERDSTAAFLARLRGKGAAYLGKATVNHGGKTKEGGNNGSL